jgi:CheY-like chemotaxis protein
MEAIREGAVTVEGVDLTCITLKSGRDVFDRMVGGQEFDVAELSASEFISLHGTGKSPFVALPVFPSRVFRHGYIFINKRSGIRTAKEALACLAKQKFDLMFLDLNLPDIAEQSVDHHVNVLLGGGLARFQQTITGGRDVAFRGFGRWVYRSGDGVIRDKVFLCHLSHRRWFG